MSRRAAIVASLLALLLLNGATFEVSEGESAIVVRLGKISRRPIAKPGLYWKLPLFDDVIRFNARILAWDGEPERIPVKDSKFIFVDTFARWRITDPVRFYNAVKDERGAQSRLDDVLDGTVRDVVSTHYLLELVRTTNRPLQHGPARGEDEAQGTAIQQVLQTALGPTPSGAPSEAAMGEAQVAGRRVEVRDQIFAESDRKLRELNLGIEIVDLRIKRIEYTDQVKRDVYLRMVSEQQRIAERYRAQGQGKKAEIAGLTSQEQRRIESESYRTAQEILGRAEAESTRIYAAAYGKDPEFYRFAKSLETYRKALGKDDTLILSSHSDLLHYLQNAQPQH
ncbi:MAG TPA: protease modulator HflC [Thermoanaerobaculia bacterium]|nr:protease modulator HflC [Thermoanaerobaculia bacterium]